VRANGVGVLCADWKLALQTSVPLPFSCGLWNCATEAKASWD